MSGEKWFVCKVKDFMTKRNTKINNLANIYSDDSNYSEEFFDLPDKTDSYPLFMCYKLFSLFDPENKGYITLKSIEDWSKFQYNSLCQITDLNSDAKSIDRYKSKIQRVCNSIETFKNNYTNHLKIKEGREDIKIDTQSILITISEFIGFVSVIFDNKEDIIKADQKSIYNHSAVHFAHLFETNVCLTNYFGTVTNTDPAGKFIPRTSSPSLFLEPKAKSVSRGESRPFKNNILFVSDSNLYHSSLWSPCVVPHTSSLHSMARELNKMQNE
ncbi:hypothetical protein OJ252_138 [Cryptosporidium canis]|uniref:EF-hand domain-containing protein n=1 Tax=Cryptosporidium canis TaxID=195482 RepID=A0ABQ8PEK2_9CRYT|nr:hypothetical protein OJ252_138 [Cryptosporidium canis]